MAQSIELHLAGTTRTTTRVNLRQGLASTKAPILRKLEPGTVVDVRAVTIGESVNGNAHWYATAENAFLWSGGCAALTATPLPPGAGPGIASPQAAAVVSPWVRVVDMSHLIGVTSFSEARQAGLLGVIHKATTGATGRDDWYRNRRTQAQDAGLLWGAYHWGTAFPIEDQVDNFLDWAQPNDETLLALDFEETPGNQMTLAMARSFLEEVMHRVGRRAVIYGGGFLKSQLGNTKDAFFGAHRLWLAQYGPQAIVQASWDSYWLWQYSDGRTPQSPSPKTVPGIVGNSRGELDCDHFDGTDAELRAQWA